MTEPKDVLVVNEQLRSSIRMWRTVALAACAALMLMALLSFVAASRARIQTERALLAETEARQSAVRAQQDARDAAAKAVNPGQLR
jgi:hypothetical protein